MNGKTIVLFDIDHTMFDAAKYRQRMMEIIAEHIPLEDKKRLFTVMESAYFSHRKKIGYVDLEFMLHEVLAELAIETDVASLFLEILEEESSYEEAIFEETIEVVEKLAKQENLTLGIFSSGREDHQLRKIKSFAQFFDKNHIHIFKIKDKEIPRVMDLYKDDKVVLIDDMLTILYSAKQAHKNIRTIWIKRGRFAENQQPIPGFTPDYTIDSLQELIPILT